MNLYDTEEIKNFKADVFSDLFKLPSINLSFKIMLVDKEHSVKIPELEQDDLVKLLTKIYLYFIDPTPINHYQGYAYNFFDDRLRQAKHLNPLKNLYEYGKVILNVFVEFVQSLERFFKDIHLIYIDYLTEIKKIKQFVFDEHHIFYTTLEDYAE